MGMENSVGEMENLVAQTVVADNTGLATAVAVRTDCQDHKQEHHENFRFDGNLEELDLRCCLRSSVVVVGKTVVCHHSAFYKHLLHHQTTFCYTLFCCLL